MGNQLPVILRITVVIALSLYCAQLNAQLVRRSVQSGNWSNKNTWDCACLPGLADHVIVVSGHRVAFQATNMVHHLTIEQDAVLTDNGLPNTITGDLLVNGTYSGSGVISLTGENATLGGTGIISNLASLQITGNKTIPANTSLTINISAVLIQGAYTITNHGAITVGGNINGTEVASSWVNETNATLNIGGTSGAPLLATGTLYASAPGNTINYYAAYAHTLKLPAAVSGYSTYHHLRISGTNTKTMPNGDVAINGDLTIHSTFSGSGTNKKIFVRGNWINYGNFTEGTGGSTITFDGTGDQYITRAATENMNVIVVNKPSGKLILHTNVIAERGLTMTSGDINTNGNTLTLGLNAATVGTLTWSSGTIIGKFERWVATAGVPVHFPIGTSTEYRPAQVWFNSLTAGTLIAEFISASPGMNGLPLMEDGVSLYNSFRDGYWSLTAGNSLDTLNYDLDLTGNGFSGFIISDNTRLLRRPSAVDPWALYGQHAARAGNTVRRSNLSLLSGQYCFADDTNCIAPVTSSITGLQEVCREESGVLYSVANNPPNTYSWKVDGGTLASGNDTNSITVDWGANGMNGSVSVIEKNACTEGAEVTQPIRIHALPLMSMTGKWMVAENNVTAETYTIPPQPDYTFTWTVVGGVIASGQNTNSITVNWGDAGIGSVCAVGNHTPVLPVVSCGQSVSLCKAISIYKVIHSVRSGNWQTSVNWDCACVPGPADNVTVQNTHIISLTNNRTIQHLNINAGGAINTNSNTLQINGDLNVNGLLGGSGPVILNGSNTLLDGIGIITNTGPLTIYGSVLIHTQAVLTKNSGDVTIGTGAMVTHNGTIYLGGSVVGSDINSQWINAAHSTLHIAGELLTTGKLFASANENTIQYVGTNAQMIKTPESQQYVHLMFSGNGVKSAPSLLLVSGNFINDGNFLAGSGTITFNGSSQIGGSSSTTFRHLSLLSGSSLTLPANSIQVFGNINFSPASLLDANDGTVSLEGDAIQQIDVYGANFNTLAINKSSGGVNLNSTLGILHLLDFKTATPFATNDHLVIRSRGITTQLDGSIGPVPAGNLFSGDVTIERYMNPTGKTFRYVTSPVDGALPPSTLGVLYDHIYSSGVGNWKIHSSLLPMERTRGYAAWVPGSINPIVWSVSGPILHGEHTWDFNEEGWHLVGNPYPSAIRWYDHALAWDLDNVATTIAVTDNSVSGYPNYFRYWSYDDVDNPDDWGSGEMQHGVVAMGQAFWVYVGDGGGSLTIYEGAKESDLSGKFYRKNTIEDTALKIMLTNDHSADIAYLRIREKATDGYDFSYDVRKLWNEEVNLYWENSSDNYLSINSVSRLASGAKLPIGLEVRQEGNYALSFMHADKFRYGKQLYLTDTYERKRVPITDGEYSFSVDEGSLSCEGRFYLAFDNRLEESQQEIVEVFPNPVKDKLSIRLRAKETGIVTLMDIRGTEIFSSEIKGSGEMDMSSYPGGIYLIRISINTGKVITQKIVK